MARTNDSIDREVVNNQKRIIRELKRIADALEACSKQLTGINLAQHSGNPLASLLFDVAANEQTSDEES